MTSPSRESLRRADVGHRATLRKYTKKPPFAPHLLIGSGGTFTSLAEMIMVQKGQFGLPTRGYTVTRADVSHLLDRLRNVAPRGVACRAWSPIGPTSSSLVWR